MERLFVYGTLGPGRPNEHVMQKIGGSWQPASVRGRLVRAGWGFGRSGLPALVLAVQVLFAWSVGHQQRLPSAERRRLAILVPAHNESAVIADTLASLLPQLAEGDRLLVVADNCTDDTAGIAMAAGSEVIKRTDSERRGKGYALDYGVRHLAQKPPEVLIIVDADCRVTAQTIEWLARRCSETPGGGPREGAFGRPGGGPSRSRWVDVSRASGSRCPSSSRP